MSDQTLIIFDFDGTLTSLKVNWDNVRLRLSKIAKSNDLGVTQIVDLVRADAAKFSHVIKIIEEEELESLKNTVPKDKILSIYKKVKVSGVNTAIFTSNCRKTVIKFLEIYKLEGPDMIMALEDVEKSKPDPDGIIKLANIFQTTSKNIVMIGDSPKDEACAMSAGCKFISTEALELSTNNFI